MRNNKGFTLVELLAVIVILAIIMIISIPAVLDTMTTAKRKTFGEYVTKVYNVAQNKFMSNELLGESKPYVKYDVTKDLDLGSTGTFKGYVVFLRKGGDVEVFIGLSDGEYHTATRYGNDDSQIVNYINYTMGGEPTYSNNLEVMDGEKNYFISGSIDDFGLPDEPSNPADAAAISLPISKENVSNGGGVVLSAEEKFEKGIREFVSNVKRDFEVDKNNTNSPHKIMITQEDNYDFGGKVVFTNYVYAYKVSDYYSDSNKSGYMIIFRHYAANTPAGVPISIQGSYIAYKDENYHTVMQVYGKNPSGENVTEKMPVIQLNEQYYSHDLNLKRINTLTTYNLTTEFQKAAIDNGLEEAVNSGDEASAFLAHCATMNQLMNSAHFYCSNTNSSCSLPNDYYNYDYVTENHPFETELDLA